MTASVRRIAHFTAVRYETHHLLYAVLFVAAVEATAAVVSHPDSAWLPGWQTAVRVAVVAVLLLYLRMVDEIKDIDYDRVHNPDRPLVTGAVGVRELWVAIGVIAASLTAVSLLLSWWSAVLVVAAMAYGLGLWALEARSARVRDTLLLNLIVTYPVQLWILAYIVCSAIDTGQVESEWRTAAVAVLFAAAFLHFEFARKTVSGGAVRQSYYSNVLGPLGSTVAIVGFAVVAVGADIVLVRPWDHALFRSVLLWGPVLLLALPLAAARSFVRGSRGPVRLAAQVDSAAAVGPRKFPVVPAVVFVLVLYLILIVQALTWR